MAATPHRVVIVGAGFGGLEATYRLAGAPVEITLIDRRNHHLFQPLLYQVATASLATSEIAWPIRYLLRDRPDVTTLFANACGVDAAGKRVLLDDGSIPYDTLILATGARHAYFGHDEWEPFAPGLKTLEDATTLRRRILVAFERAERGVGRGGGRGFLGPSRHGQDGAGAGDGEMDQGMTKLRWHRVSVSCFDRCGPGRTALRRRAVDPAASRRTASATVSAWPAKLGNAICYRYHCRNFILISIVNTCQVTCCAMAISFLISLPAVTAAAGTTLCLPF